MRVDEVRCMRVDKVSEGFPTTDSEYSKYSTTQVKVPTRNHGNFDPPPED
jgi:hypothetical protein